MEQPRIERRINGIFVTTIPQQPTLELLRGFTYTFDQTDSTNGTHPIAVSTTDVAHNSTSNFAAGTTGHYLAGVYEGTEANAATAKADHPGNIRIESSEIYIYV